MKITARTLSAKYGVKVTEDLKTGRTYQTKWYYFYKEKDGAWYYVSVGKRRFGFREPKEDQVIGWILSIEKYLPNAKVGNSEYLKVMKEKGHITERRYSKEELPFRVSYPPLFGDIYATYWVDVMVTQVEKAESVWNILKMFERRG